MRALVGLAILLLVIQTACTPAAAPVSIGNKPVSVNGVSTNEARERATVELSEMSWAGFEGGVTKLKDLQGKAVVLDFWATNSRASRRSRTYWSLNRVTATTSK